MLRHCSLLYSDGSTSRDGAAAAVGPGDRRATTSRSAADRRTKSRGRVRLIADRVTAAAPREFDGDDRKDSEPRAHARVTRDYSAGRTSSALTLHGGSGGLNGRRPDRADPEPEPFDKSDIGLRCAVGVDRTPPPMS